MKLALINPERGPCPPDGFRYVFPQDGFVAHAWTYVDWIDLANKHARANNLPDPDPADMQYQLCQTLEPGWCQYDDPNRPRPSTTIAWNDVMEGGKILSLWIATGMQAVQKTESERRALICSRCYLNVNVQGCGACHDAVDILTKSLSTKYDFALKACAACKCLLRAKVHAPMEVLDKESERVQQMYPEHCWLKKSGVNYVR